MFPNMWPDEAVPRFLTQALDDCDGHNISPTSTTTFNEDLVDDNLSLVSSGLESTLSCASLSAVSLKDFSIASKSTQQTQESLKRFGDWNQTIKYSQRIVARHELRRRARTAAVQVETFIESLSSAVTNDRVDRVLVSQYSDPKVLDYREKNEDSEDMEFMSMLSARSALSDLSLDSRISTHGSVLHSSRSDISEIISLSGSKCKHAGKTHSRGLDAKPQETPKQQLARRRISLYMQSRDPFRLSFANDECQPAKLEEERMALANLCQRKPCSAPCNNMDVLAAADVKNKSLRKQYILISATVFVFTSVACAALLIFTH